jgi:hypothetical protein
MRAVLAHRGIRRAAGRRQASGLCSPEPEVREENLEEQINGEIETTR